MYSLDLEYVDETFDSIQQLINYVLEKGIDPATKIVYNGEVTEERVEELIVP